MMVHLSDTVIIIICWINRASWINDFM